MGRTLKTSAPVHLHLESGSKFPMIHRMPPSYSSLLARTLSAVDIQVYMCQLRLTEPLQKPCKYQAGYLAACMSIFPCAESTHQIGSLSIWNHQGASKTSRKGIDAPLLRSCFSLLRIPALPLQAVMQSLGQQPLGLANPVPVSR